MILALDTGSRLVGFCVGDGSAVPIASAWGFDFVGDDLGALAEAFEEKLTYAVDRWGVTRIIYEGPILRPGDKLMKVRKLFGLGWHVEWFARRRGLPCSEASVQSVKKELAGNRWASKDDMVAAARRCGVSLPATLDAGQVDAADAFGVWLLGVRYYAKGFQPAWDRRLYGQRGALI